MNKDSILKALFDLGFRTEEIDYGGYVFDFEGLRLLFNQEDDDTNFYRISAPCIYEVEEEENRPIILEIINEVNCRFKYVKSTLSGNSVWIAYEARLTDEVDAEEFVRYAVMIVWASVELFNRKLNGDDTPADENGNDENDNEEEDND